MARANNGCAFGRETRVMVKNIEENINNLSKKVDTMFNHMSNRLPPWATIIMTLLCSLVTGLIVHGLMRQ